MHIQSTYLKGIDIYREISFCLAENSGAVFFWTTLVFSCGHKDTAVGIVKDLRDSSGTILIRLVD